ncbi:MAG: dehydrogenase, partial [Planctomycetes bacterium]|nr:dehydrogenase [Planctomycetota bacterium]
ANHGRDFLYANDTWFRGVELKYGPDGEVYVSDWTDFGECHDNDGIHQDSGRIYRVTYTKNNKVRGRTSDLNGYKDLALVHLLFHKNDWWRQHAQRILQERSAAGKLSTDDVHDTLRTRFGNSTTSVVDKLRCLWTLHGTGGADRKFLTEQLANGNEHIRWWTIKLLCEDRKASPELLMRFAEMARSDKSPLVRLGLASAMQRLPHESRWPIAEGLLSHADDAQDHNLPLMIWYGIEPLVATNSVRAIQLAAKSKIPLVRQYIARRIAEK